MTQRLKSQHRENSWELKRKRKKLCFRRIKRSSVKSTAYTVKKSKLKRNLLNTRKTLMSLKDQMHSSTTRKRTKLPKKLNLRRRSKSLKKKKYKLPEKMKKLSLKCQRSNRSLKLLKKNVRRSKQNSMKRISESVILQKNSDKTATKLTSHYKECKT